jgi:hypothetical protein
MKKLLMLVCALAIGSSVFAAQGKKVSADYSGIVEKYDAATKTLTVKRNDKQGEFVLSDTSEVLEGREKKDAAAFTAGRKVDVEFVMDGSKKVILKAKLGAATATK